MHWLPHHVTWWIFLRFEFRNWSLSFCMALIFESIPELNRSSRPLIRAYDVKHDKETLLSMRTHITHLWKSFLLQKYRMKIHSFHIPPWINEGIGNWAFTSNSRSESWSITPKQHISNRISTTKLHNQLTKSTWHLTTDTAKRHSPTPKTTTKSTWKECTRRRRPWKSVPSSSRLMRWTIHCVYIKSHKEIVKYEH